MLVRSEVLGQLVNTLTADWDKHSALESGVIYRNKFKRRFLKRNAKTFSRFFIAFLKCTLNLEYFEKKDQSHSLSITEIINSETSSYLKV